jgi:uncharacterized membrane protein YgaE (UPF0421/DUF939 family)
MAYMKSPNDENLRRTRQRMRSVAIAVSLGALCVLFFIVTIVKFGGNMAVRP